MYVLQKLRNVLITNKKKKIFPLIYIGNFVMEVFYLLTNIIL